ncbi:uncharacterized protein at5g39865 [Phtheirospermum japonicum]|uniref:Uncharacterized protein at5g39865 n=1 Tax=Phtheirospermum japonicum TaxID=374723 RepID=A0A830CUG4_9LAMI|nr:uncharacterized protein at5g39865 [Phtheirospermum japonicum]
MADRKTQGTGYAAGKKLQNNNSKINPSSVFNRSLTVNSSAAAANNPLYNLYTTPAFQRNGSVKGLHGSSFGSAGNSFSGKVRKLRSIFESSKHPSTNHNSQSPPLPSPTPTPKNAPSPVPDSRIRLPGTEDRIVIYFTSLRGIRRTFQDCHSIRLIFRGFRVNLDERDISMDVAYRKELQKVLGENNLGLPQVFIKGKHIGGADVVKHMLEVGELARMIKGLPLRAMKPCDACDDVRFIPCTNCSGSRKVFDEDEEQPKRCPECNENGLARCPLCCM